MALQIEDPGLHTTVQDLGRPGHYHIGVPLGGAMDTLSHEVANHLVGNDSSLASSNAPTLDRDSLLPLLPPWL